MNLVPQLVEVDGRVLPQEDIYMANRVQFKSGPDVDWTRNLRTNEMLHTVTLKKWLLVFPGKLEQQARALFQSLQQVGTGMKFQIPTPNRYVFAQCKIRTSCISKWFLPSFSCVGSVYQMTTHPPIYRKSNVALTSIIRNWLCALFRTVVLIDIPQSKKNVYSTDLVIALFCIKKPLKIVLWLLFCSRHD